MKHNLKTFPVKSTPQAYERWFKKFKKELKKELEMCDFGLPYCEKCEKIMEILGETE